MEIENKPKKKLYENIFSILTAFTCILLFILGLINLYQELPDNISNQTILIFVLAFGLILVNRD